MDTCKLLSLTKINVTTLNYRKIPTRIAFHPSHHLRMPNAIKSFIPSAASISASSIQHLLSVDPCRRDNVLQHASDSVSNCLTLTETNLDLTVPGIKSKTRGKVNFLPWFAYI